MVAVRRNLVNRNTMRNTLQKTMLIKRPTEGPALAMGDGLNPPCCRTENGAGEEDRGKNQQKTKTTALEELNGDAVEERQVEMGAMIECATSQLDEIKVCGPVEADLLDGRIGE